MKRIVIPNNGPDDKVIPKAIAVGIKQCQTFQAKELTLIAPSKKDFSTTIFGKSLGDDACKKLIKGEKVSLVKDISLSLESASTIEKFSRFDVILAVYLSQKSMTSVDCIQSAKAVIYLPWLTEDGAEWQKTWNAEVFGETTPQDQLQLHPEVEAGLKSLTSVINLSTGLSHSSDKKFAQRKFSEFREKKLTFEPNDIRTWAVRNKWRADDADELAALASKYKD